MSTKALLGLIQKVRRDGTEEEAGLAVEALMELAEIQKAAKFLVSDLQDLDGAAAAMATMQSVAAETPRELPGSESDR